MIDFENSIVIIGGVGAGKSLTSRTLHEKTGIPVITTDILRRCPKTIEEIDNRTKHEQDEIIRLEEKIATCQDEKEKNRLKRIVADKKNELWVLSEQRILREKMPNLPNYLDYGYNGDVANFLRENFGDIAWHFYQKQFEQMLLEDICKHYNGPAILDLGGGMVISLDRDYSELYKFFNQLDPTLFAQHFTHLEKIGFDKVKAIISHFNHVNYLKLPDDYSHHGSRAMHDGLNPKFLSTHQFDELATNVIDVGNLFINEQLNREELDKITQQIINSSTPTMT